MRKSCRRLWRIRERWSSLLGRQNRENQDKIPTTLNIVNSVKHIEDIIKGKVPSLDTVEWKDGCLYILDPFLLFYLRWGSVWRQ